MVTLKLTPTQAHILSRILSEAKRASEARLAVLDPVAYRTAVQVYRGRAGVAELLLEELADNGIVS